MGCRTVPIPEPLGGAHRHQNSPLSGGSQAVLGRTFGGWGGATLSRVFEAFLKFSRAPPSEGGSISMIFACSPLRGGATPILGSILGVGAEQGGAHTEIFTSEKLTGSPPDRGEPGAEPQGTLGCSGGSHRLHLGKRNDTPTLGTNRAPWRNQHNGDFSRKMCHRTRLMDCRAF